MRRLTINACGWVVLDTQVNVLIDAKSKVACVTEVASEQLILLYLQSTLLKNTLKRLAAASVSQLAMRHVSSASVTFLHDFGTMNEDAMSITFCTM